mgnify:CR=1 FL=1
MDKVYISTRKKNSIRSSEKHSDGLWLSLLHKEDFHKLVRVVAAYGDPQYAATLSGIAFSKDNLHWLKVLNRRVQVKWVRGYLAVVFKGQNPPFGFTHAGMAHEKLKEMTGAYISVRANGFGCRLKKHILHLKESRKAP